MTLRAWQRLAMVGNHLVSQGVQASRIALISYGKERPLCNEKNEACWAKNRRAHSPIKE